MRLLSRRGIVAAVLTAALVAPGLARTGEFAGACSLNFTMNFSPSLRLTGGGMIDWSIPQTNPPTSNGTCMHTGGGTTSVSIGGSGEGLTVSCEALNLNGNVNLIFDEGLPSVPGASLSLTGTIQSAEVTILRPGPLGSTVIGVASLTGMAHCLNDELQSVNFSGRLLVIDP